MCLLLYLGGGGAGKSTLINVVTRQCDKVLSQVGDDPNQPKILLLAPTGMAACVIGMLITFYEYQMVDNKHSFITGGSTIQSVFPFKFGLNDGPTSSRKMEELRHILGKVELIIIDEFSMVGSDMLYRLHRKLCDIYLSQDYFGGKALILVGDPMQFRPINEDYIFNPPKSIKSKPFHSVDPLWSRFDVAILTTNHRQGDGNEWTEMLNRFRIGIVTDEDRMVLETRRLKFFPDFNTDLATHAFYTNKEVAHYNSKMLNKLSTPIFAIKAICKFPAKYKPKIKESGTIDKTQFMDSLEVKVGAPVMVIYNINTRDSLVNGARGLVINMVEESSVVKAIIVKFDNPEAGLEQVKDHQHFMEKHGLKSGVPIFRVLFEYPLPYSKGKKTHGCTGKINQFPIRLSWGSTAHKLQGSTIGKHSSLVAHGHSKTKPAMNYVMLSRCANFENVYLDEKFDIDKIKCCEEAKKAYENLIERNIVPSVNNSSFDLYMVNTRSLKLHLRDLETDIFATKSNVVAVVETWINPDEERHINSSLGIFHGASLGRGKGCGAFLCNPTDTFSSIENQFQILSVAVDERIQIVIVYLSNYANFQQVITALQKHFTFRPTSYLIGDFNFDAQENNVLKKFLIEKGFIQMITRPTHERGRTIDHFYVPHNMHDLFEISYTYPYFTDHAALCVKIKKN